MRSALTMVVGLGSVVVLFGAGCGSATLKQDGGMDGGGGAAGARGGSGGAAGQGTGGMSGAAGQGTGGSGGAGGQGTGGTAGAAGQGTGGSAGGAGQGTAGVGGAGGIGGAVGAAGRGGTGGVAGQGTGGSAGGAGQGTAGVGGAGGIGGAVGSAGRGGTGGVAGAGSAGSSGSGGSCAGAPNGTTCNDGNACTQTDTCQNGTCTGSNPVVCSSPTACHTMGTCNTGTGVCSMPNAPDNTACNAGLGACAAGSCSTPHFTRFGQTFGPVAIAADGSVVVGNSTDTTIARWTRSTGFQAVALFPGTNACSLSGISADGAYEVGSCFTTTSLATRWPGLNAPVNLDPNGIFSGANPGAIATSSNGSVTCGNATGASGTVVALFRSGSSPTALTNPANAVSSYCTAINGDGSVIVGSVLVDLGSGNFEYRSFRWTQASGIVVLPPAGGTTALEGATGVSADGIKVVGNAGGGRAFLYNATTGTTTMPIYPGDSASAANAISDDGTTVVGGGNSGLWTSTSGATPVLIGTTLAGLGVDLTGFTLSNAIDVSADGKVIVGYGYTGTRGMEGWIAVLK